MATSFPIEAKVSPAIKDIKALEDAIRKTGKEAGLAENQIEEIVKATKKARNEGGKNFNEVNKSLDGINSTLKKVGAAVVASFTVDKIKAFISEVVKITAEFQKLESVLVNTLGSRGSAQRALADIKSFAARTPFSVLELTDSFVKLVNQGFKPTQNELRKLGDLASSQAKGFDQLTEAIIDAQTGEFERLKEFGIRASKEGDKVTFTFKGVQTQTEFTADSIREYILSLGDAAGVSGSMAAISETLEGKISNLGDAYDNFLNTVGSRSDSQRLTNNFLFFLQEKLGLLTDLVETDEQKLQRLVNESANSALESFKASGLSAEEYNSILEKSLDLQRKRYEALAQDSSATQEQLDKYYLQIESTKESIKAIKEYTVEIAKNDALKKKAAEDRALAAAQKEEEKRLKKLAAEYKKLNEERDKFLFSLKEGDFLSTQKNAEQAVKDISEKFGLGTSGGKFGDIIGSLEPPPEEEGLTDRELNLIKNRVDAHKDAVDTMRDYTIDAFEEVFRSRIINSQREIDVLDAQYKYEIAQAGNNEKVKADITKRFEAQRISLLNRQAQQQQQAAIFSILANQGPAVAKTASTLGFPLAIPFIAAVLGLFALTLSNQKQVQPPKFAAEGDFDIKGPGTETSDSIPYMLSVHETVNPARNTKRFPWLLGPMVKKKDFNEYDLRYLVDKHLPTEYNPVFFNRAQGGDSPEMLEELRATRRAIENKKETHFTYDEEGFNVWIGREGQWTKRANKKYSM